MKIFYDVKKRRLIIRLTIVIISIFALIVVIKGYFATPSITTTLATHTPKKTSSVVPVQSSLPANTTISSHSSEPAPTSSASIEDTPTFLPSPALSSSVVTPSPSHTSMPDPQSTKNTALPTVSIVNTPTADAPLSVTNKPTATTTKIPPPTVVTKPTTSKTLKPTAPSIKYTATPKISNTKKPSGALQVTYFNSNKATSSNTINPMFMLINNTKENINLLEVKIRYYFTADSNIKQNFWCDWCSSGTSNVFGRFVELKTTKANADQYLEIGFSNASGVIEAGKTVEIQTRFSKDNWTDYSQSNDYSFNPSKEYIKSNKVTLHLKGDLIFGKEP